MQSDKKMEFFMIELKPNKQYTTEELRSVDEHNRRLRSILMQPEMERVIKEIPLKRKGQTIK